MHPAILQSEIPRVSAGAPISATEYNLLVDTVNDLRKQVLNMQRPEPVNPMLVEFTNDLRVDDEASAEWLMGSTASPGTDPFTRASGVVRRVRDSDGIPYLSGERHLGVFNGELGKWTPIPATEFRIGKLAGALASGGSVSMNLWYYDGSSFVVTDPAIAITVFDWLLPDGTTQEIPENARAVAMWLRHARIWIIIAASC